MKIFMADDADLQSDGLMLVKWVDRTRLSSLSYGEGESYSRRVENNIGLSKSPALILGEGT